MSRYLRFMLQKLSRSVKVAALFTATASLHLALVTNASDAGIAELADSTKEMAIGQKNAPLTIIEYASLGCSHCAKFHQETYPVLKKDYIDTGKVKLIFRDFPLGTPALAATMIARCSGPKRYFGFVEMFFRSQTQWSHAGDPLQALTKIARLGGMPPSDVQACMRNQKLLEYIQLQKKHAYEKDGINATPYFVIGTENLSGSLPYNQIKIIIERELNKIK